MVLTDTNTLVQSQYKDTKTMRETTKNKIEM